MAEQNKIDAAVNCGVPPLQIAYRAMLDAKTRKAYAFRSQLLINSLELGVLKPDDYGYIANRSAQATRLGSWNQAKIIQAAQTLADSKCAYAWVSVALPVKMIMKDGFAESLLVQAEKAGDEAKTRLCIEYPQEILFEDTEKVKKGIVTLKNAGVRTMLTGYGNEFCPTLRLSGMRFDYVVLDRELCIDNSKLEQLVSVSHIVRSSGSQIVYETDGSEKAFTKAYSNSAAYCFVAGKTEEEDIFSEFVEKGGVAET